LLPATYFGGNRFSISKPFCSLTANAASVVGTSRDSQTNNRRSALLRAGLFGDMRLSTLICWRRTKISASRRALDWNSPMSAPQSNLSNWTIVQQHHPIRTGSPAIWSFRQGQHGPSIQGRGHVVADWARRALPLTGGCKCSEHFLPRARRRARRPIGSRCLPGQRHLPPQRPTRRAGRAAR